MQRLGSILAQMKLPGPGMLERRALETAVAKAFGAAARDLRVASYRRGRLVIEARSAARAFELQAFARGAARDALRRHAGLEKLSEIVFKNGSWRSHGQQ